MLDSSPTPKKSATPIDVVEAPPAVLIPAVLIPAVLIPAVPIPPRGTTSPIEPLTPPIPPNSLVAVAVAALLILTGEPGIEAKDMAPAVPIEDLYCTYYTHKLDIKIYTNTHTYYTN
jgi:hypothetical protein